MKSFFHIFLPLLFLGMFFVGVNKASALDCEYGPTEDETRCMTLSEWCSANPTSSFCGTETANVNANSCSTGFALVGGLCLPTNSGLSSAPISQILSNIFSWLTGLFTTLAIIAFIISGIQYLTSAGDTDQIETAKRNATHSLLGVIIGLSGFIIVQAIAKALGGNSIFF